MPLSECGVLPEFATGNELPNEAFTQRLTAVFAEARAERVTFHNPLQNREFTQTIYLARHPMCGSANRSLSHIEPVSGTPKRK